MIVILGLVILVAAVVIGVLGNGGSAHAPHHGFAVFGYHVTGSAGTLFLYGIVVRRRTVPADSSSRVSAP